MKKLQTLPVEEARKKFADVLDGSQFRDQHTEITRRGKAAGYVVPPEWYEAQKTEMEALRKKVEELSAAATRAPAGREEPSPAVAAPRQQVAQAVSAPTPHLRRTREEADAEVEILYALVRDRATPMQWEALEQLVSRVPESGRERALLGQATTYDLLSNEELNRTAYTEQRRPAVDATEES